MDKYDEKISPALISKYKSLLTQNEMPDQSQHYYLLPIQKWPIRPISALHEKFNPRNINYMSVVKFFVRLDLDLICLILDAHYLKMMSKRF